MKTNNLKKITITGMLSLVMLMLVACTNSSAIGIKGNGKIVNKERIVQVFTGIDASGAFNIILTQNDSQKVMIETDENIEPVIITEVKDGILKISNKENIKNPTKLNIYINVKSLNSIETSGASDIEMTNTFKSTDFQIKGSGASDLKINLECTTLSINSSGAGDFDLQGSATDLKLDFSGASEIKAYSFSCQNAKIEMSGAGSARINASQTISGNLSGVGSIFYKGTPSIKELSISGLGKISEVK